MARPKKPINFEDEILKIEMQIARHQNTISKLEDQREKLLQEKKNVEVSSLYDAVVASGKKVDEIVAMLQTDMEKTA